MNYLQKNLKFRNQDNEALIELRKLRFKKVKLFQKINLYKRNKHFKKKKMKRSLIHSYLSKQLIH